MHFPLSGSKAHHASTVHSTTCPRCKNLSRHRYKVSPASISNSFPRPFLGESAALRGAFYNSRSDIDHSYFVLTVDLWSADGQKEVNLVRHSTCSPSISAGSTTSYPPPLDPPRAPDQLMDGMGRPLIDGHGRPITGQVVLQAQTTMYGRGRQDYSQNRNYPRQNQLSDHMEQFQREQQYTRSQHSQVIQSSQTQEGHYTSAAVTPSTPTSLTGFYGQHHQQGPLLSPDQMPQTVDPRSQANGMFTRNLIGSLCVSAFKLTNEDGEVGIWFILQDLSIRTEGTFR